MAGKPTRLKDICFDSLVFVKLNLLTEILGDTKLSDSWLVLRNSFNLAILLGLTELSIDLAILEKLRLLAALSHVAIVVHWLHNYIMLDTQNMLEDDKGYNFIKRLNSKWLRSSW